MRPEALLGDNNDMLNRGKKPACWAVTMGVVVLVAVGLTSRDRILETWWLYRLEYGDSKERRDAAERLGEIGSLRALPRLLRVLADDGPVTLGTGAVVGTAFAPDGTVLAASDFNGDGMLDLVVANTGTLLSTNEILRFCTCPEFRFIHLPVDPAYLQALLKITQRRAGETVSFLINTLEAKDEETRVLLVAAESGCQGVPRRRGQTQCRLP